MKSRLIASALVASAMLIPAAGEVLAARPAEIQKSDTARREIAFKLRKGQVLSYSLSGTQRLETLEGDALGAVDMTVAMPVRLEVQGVEPDGAATVTTSFGDGQIEISVNNKRFDEASARKAFRAARVTQKVRPDGTVGERTGDLADDGTPAKSNAFVADILSGAWVAFPPEPIAVGESWTQNVPLAMNDASGNLVANVRARYTLAGFANVGGARVAVVDAHYDAFVDGNIPSAASADITIGVVGRGQGTGHLLFDLEAGILVETEMSMGMVMTMEQAGGRRTTQSITSRSQYTLNR